MKHCIIAIALLLVTAPAYAIDINAGISGSWYNPAKRGHGFAVEYYETNCESDDGCLVAYWFAYTPEGDSLFLLGIGPVNGDTAELDVFHFSGQTFGDFTPVPTEMDWGTLTLQFDDCDNGTASYQSDFESPQGTPYGNGEFPITRLASIGSLSCNKAGRLAAMPDHPAAGVWLGSAVSRGFDDDDFQESRGVGAIILDSGEAYLFWPEPAVYRGMLSGDDINLSGNLGAYAGFPATLRNEQPTGSSRITTGDKADLTLIAQRPGRGNAGDFLEGHFKGAGLEGDFRLVYQSESNRDNAMSHVTRCWSFGGNVNMSSTPTQIAGDGSFSIEYNGDCNFEGIISNDVASWNVYGIEGNVTGGSCDFTGEYSGVATLLDSAAGDRAQMLFAVDNGTNSLSGLAVRLNDSQCQ